MYKRQELYAVGDTPGTDTPVDTTVTEADGTYFLSAPPGDYFVHIPVSEFGAGEPLEGSLSTVGQDVAELLDDDVNENGDDVLTDGVSSATVTLLADSEPVGETGFSGIAVSPVDDDDTNSTIDFGFFTQVSIGNVVFSDDGAGGGVSNNGILDGAEVGIAGVEVELYEFGDTPGTDAPVDTTCLLYTSPSPRD